MAMRISPRLPLLLVLALVAPPALAQQLPSIPPDRDPAYWARPHLPYTLSRTITRYTAEGSKPPETHMSQEKVYRDDAGRERTEDFYDSGQPSGGSLRDPSQDSMVILKVIDKTAIIVPVPNVKSIATAPPYGWTVEPLPKKTIAGLSAEGMRFTRTIPPQAGADDPVGKVVNDIWISPELGVVLEQVCFDPKYGKRTMMVTKLDRVEADPVLFQIPHDYTIKHPLGMAE